jgi:hypothetical protein
MVLLKTEYVTAPYADDLRRMPLLGTWVNKAIYSTLQLRFCLNEFLDVLNALLHRAGDGILHRFIDRHLGSES